MDQKPPRCPKRCPITPLCRHGTNIKVLLVGFLLFLAKISLCLELEIVSLINSHISNNSLP